MTPAYTVSWWRVARNALSLLLREFLNKGTYLVLGMVIARSMGREAFGDYALSLLLSRSFFTIGDLGFGTWLVREVSQSREQTSRYFTVIGVYRFLTGLAVVLLLYGFLSVSRYNPSLQRHILLSAIAFFFLHLTSFIFSFFRAFEKMGSELEINLLKNTLFIGGGLWAISRGSLTLFYALFIFSNGMALAYALVLYGRRIGWGGFRWEWVRLEGVFPIWMIQSVAMLYLYLDTVLLSFFRGISEVALYQAAYSFLEVLFVLSTVLSTSLFPVFSRLAKVSPEELPAFYEETFHAVLFFFVPCGILALFGAKTLLGVFYGPSFQDALPALYILLSGFLLFIFGGLNGHLLIAIGKEKSVLGITAGCTLLNLFMNLWVIPSFGFLGASFTTLISELFMFSLVMYAIAGAFGRTSFLQGGGLFFWIPAIWVLFLLSLARLSFWIQLPVGVGLYGLFAVLFRRTLTKELSAFKAIWKGFRKTLKVSDQLF